MIRHRLLVAVFASMAMTGWSQEIIVESYADGQNSQGFSSVEGKWTESSAKSTAPGLTATKSVFNDANTDPAVARFTPDIPADGQYEVFITYPTSGNASDIKYKIVHADGTKELELTQHGREFSHSPAANQWYSLGTFRFSAGNAGYVEVSDPLTGEKPMANEPNARIYADAVRFVAKGGASPSATTALTPETVVSAESEAARASTEAAGATTAPAAPATAALPSLPGATTAPAGASTAPTGDMPGLSAVQATPSSAASAMPALPDTAAADPAAQMPGLPESTPGSASALPPLPGDTAPAPGLPGLPDLPASTPAAAPGLPDLPTAQAAATATPGLPDLPATTSATPGLPDLPATQVTQTQVTTTVQPTATPVVTAQMTPYPVPDLPSLAPVTPTPERRMPSPADTPAAGTVPSSLPGGALSNLPPMPTAAPAPTGPAMDMASPMGTPAMMGTPSSAPMPPTMGSMPGMPGTSPTPPPPGTSISQYNPANLQWVYDFGSALNTAQAQNKKVMVFFTAEGNRAAQTYETQYFTQPNLRQMLNNYVLVKVDFPNNTRLGYSLGVFGAGMIVITDQTGTVTSRIEQLPANAAELVQQMNATGPVRRSGTPAAGQATPVADAQATTDPASLLITLYNRALSLHQARQYDAAQLSLEDLVARLDRESQLYAQAQKLRAQIHYGKGLAAVDAVRLETARQELEAAIAADPQFYPAYLSLGESLMNNSASATSGTALIETALDIAGDRISEQQRYTYLYTLGQKYFDQRAYGKAASTYAALIPARERYPMYADALDRAVESYIRMGEESMASDFRETIAHLNTALRLNPSNVKALFLLGRIYLDLGQVENAIVTLRKLVELNPRFEEANHYLGNAYFRAKDNESAIRYLSSEISNNSENYSALVDRAEVYIEMGEANAAEADLTSARQLNPEHWRSYYLTGLLAFSQKEYAAVREALLKALERRRSAIPVHLLMSRVLIEQSELDGARQWLDQIVERLDTSNDLSYAFKNYQADALTQLGEIAIKQDSPRQAENYLKSALEAAPDFAPAQVAMADTKVMLANDAYLAASKEELINQAEAHYLQALKSDPNNTDYYQKIGRFYQRHRNDNTRALEYYNTYADMGGTDSRVNAWIEEAGGTRRPELAASTSVSGSTTTGTLSTTGTVTTGTAAPAPGGLPVDAFMAETTATVQLTTVTETMVAPAGTIIPNQPATQIPAFPAAPAPQ